MCTTCMQYPQRQKRALYPMGLGSQPVVSDCYVLGTEPRSSGRVAEQLSLQPNNFRLSYYSIESPK